MRRNIRVNTIIGHVSLGSPSAEYEIKPRPKSNTCFFQFFGNCDVFFWDGLRTLSGKIEAIYLIKSLKRLITSCKEGRHNRHGLLLCRDGQWRGRRSHAPMYSAHIGTASRHRARLSRDWKGPKSRVLPWDLLRFTATSPLFVKRWPRRDLREMLQYIKREPANPAPVLFWISDFRLHKTSISRCQSQHALC